ncbi:nanos homolog 2-like [Oppia nitens]|uniref:nanos homolog 2-like n=1 Tax=Oppia nitens TaxID=1686743 RepID=UPI0023DB569A|nr:nanos homolog 2-like [Oppia nitens]
MAGYYYSFRPIVKQNLNLRNNRNRFCGFCMTNGEPAQVFESHSTKDVNGNTVCPQLMKHICELCNATGDKAHTKSHCPIAKYGRSDPIFKSIYQEVYFPNTVITFDNMVALKKTRVNSAGKRVRRYH